METLIFWNHVGREHGGLEYAPDIRKNPPDVIAQALALKERRCRDNAASTRYIRYDDVTLLELPASPADRPFLIVYRLDLGLQYSLHYKTRYPWWLIDIVDIREIRPNVFCVHDLFIDVALNPDGSYQVLDLDEYRTAIRLGVLGPEQVDGSLKSLHLILSDLHSGHFPNEWLNQLQQTFF
ncbi:hypothetical protein F4V43_13570 [Paenibacillus spiritus]|uniref:DUF402 domain-containing protein n=1 Tax=Paenibacillus spiritus TaxID=2496557 RepID=A0A5J5G5D3_9BACL|nr:hypothetical protein [Paenibacillus spiritus]KAA9002084.1 hypothetical protein F4V43_13570 [Paenibacillus spiritus]